MGQRETVYISVLLIINIIITTYLIASLHGVYLYTEIAILALVIFSTIFFIYSIYHLKYNFFLTLLIFFSFISLHSILLYYFTNKLDSLFLGLLNVFGVFLTLNLKQETKRNQTYKGNMFQDIDKNSNKMEKDHNKKINLYFDKKDDNKTNPEKKEYLIQELEQQIKKAESINSKYDNFSLKNSNQTFKSDAFTETNRYEESLEDDNETELQIEEIKPKYEEENEIKKSKKHIGKVTKKDIENFVKNISHENDKHRILTHNEADKLSKKSKIKELNKLVSELERFEEEEYDKNTKDDIEKIESLKPLGESDSLSKNSSLMEKNKVSTLKDINRLVSEIEKFEEEEYDKLTNNDVEIIEELKPIGKEEDRSRIIRRIKNKNKSHVLKDINKLASELDKLEQEENDKKINETSEIIEEIKPLDEINAQKRSKKHLKKLSEIQIINELKSEIKQLEKTRTGELENRKIETIEELKPIGNTKKSYLNNKKQKNKKISIVKKNINDLVSQIEKMEEKEYDKLTQDESEVIEELRPLNEKIDKNKKLKKNRK